jgi:hypothetical protein
MHYIVLIWIYWLYGSIMSNKTTQMLQFDRIWMFDRPMLFMRELQISWFHPNISIQFIFLSNVSNSLYTHRCSLPRLLLTHALPFSFTHTPTHYISIGLLSHMVKLSPGVSLAHTLSIYPHPLFSYYYLWLFSLISVTNTLSLTRIRAHTIYPLAFSLTHGHTLSRGVSRTHTLYIPPSFLLLLSTTLFTNICHKTLFISHEYAHTQYIHWHSL